MKYLPLLFICACTNANTSNKNVLEDTSPTQLETSNSDETTELDDTQEYFGTAPTSDLPVPEFTAHNYDSEVRNKENLIGQPTVLWFFPAAGTYG